MDKRTKENALVNLVVLISNSKIASFCCPLYVVIEFRASFENSKKRNYIQRCQKFMNESRYRNFSRFNVHAQYITLSRMDRLKPLSFSFLKY